MNTSLPPEQGIPPSGEPIPPMSIETTLHIKRLCTRDCILRATDGLDATRASDVDWHYVYDQLTKAQEYVVNAMLLKRQVDQADDDDLSDTPLVPECGHAACDSEEIVQFPTIGGEA